MGTLTTKRLLHGTQHVAELLPWLLHCINLNLKANDDDSKVKLGIADEFSTRQRYKYDRKRRFFRILSSLCILFLFVSPKPTLFVLLEINLCVFSLLGHVFSFPAQRIYYIEKKQH